jgi:hypothetical protein
MLFVKTDKRRPIPGKTAVKPVSILFVMAQLAVMTGFIMKWQCLQGA